MQKLPEVPDRKKGWRMRKREKSSSWQRGQYYLSLSGSDRRIDNLMLACLRTKHTSLDIASVIPFHPVCSSLSQSALCWNIQDPQTNYKLTLTGLWQTSRRRLTLMEARNTKWGQIHRWNDLTYFWHLNWGI